DDVIPAGAAFLDVALAGATFSAADLASPRTAPDGTVASFAGTTLTLQGGKLAAGAALNVAIDARVDSGSGDGATITNSARATPAAPLTLEIAATILPLASTQVQNVATLTDATGATQTVAAPLTVANATTTGASLTLTSARLAAAKDDLVPFVAQIGVPLGAATLGAPILTLTPSKG